MFDYYSKTPYPDWAREACFHTQQDVREVQSKLYPYFSSGARLLEVGCADGTTAKEIVSHFKVNLYAGVNLFPPKSVEDPLQFVIATAHALPFRSNAWDVILSMFLIEHIVFPSFFLDESWRILRPGGCLLVVAPDFSFHAMPSERIGLSYGCGREKLKHGKLLDALLTAYDTRLRVRLIRTFRRNSLRQGVFSFPVLTNPRCFRLPGFTSDCDAVYPVCPEEILGYLRKEKPDFDSAEIFHRNRSSFGLAVRKR